MTSKLSRGNIDTRLAPRALRPAAPELCSATITASEENE